MRIAQLLCAFRQQQMMVTVTYDGSVWSRPQPVLTTTLVGAPAMARLEDELYCLHQDANNEGRLLAAVCEGSTWGPDQSIPASAMVFSPTAAACDGTLYAIYQSRDPAAQLEVRAKRAGRPWEASGVATSGARAALSPTAATLGQAVWVAYAGGSTFKTPDGTLRLRSLRDGRWSDEQTIPVETGSAPPSAAVFDGRLRIVHTAVNDVRSLRCATREPAGSWRDEPIPFATGEPWVGAAAVAFGHELHVVYRSTSGTLASVAFDGARWHVPPQPNPPIPIAAQPGAIVN